MSVVDPVDEFDRNLYLLLGLLFDDVSFDDAIYQIGNSIMSGSSCFITTPNLNFCIASLDDPDFRDTVFASDLCLCDGIPLLWVSRLLGNELKAKVSGSDLFERLGNQRLSNGKKTRVFFFGGEGDLSEIACRRLNEDEGSIVCVGSMNPGFGSVDELSDGRIIEKINRTEADFVVVALGARKGQYWIERNRSMINAPVISHLGAVVKFVAGSVKRAPTWMQGSGLEWVWRVYQEPFLWRRYFFDGLRFLELLATRVLPYACWRLYNRSYFSDLSSPTIDLNDESDLVVLKLGGKCVGRNVDFFRGVFRKCAAKQKDLEIDLGGVEVIDGRFLGVCTLLWRHQQECGKELSFTNISPALARIFRWNCAEFLI